MGIEFQVTFDAHDPARQAEFWAAALDYQVQPPPEGFESWDAFAEKIGIPGDRRDRLSAVVDPENRGPRVLFQKVPEDKTVKNRVHLDVNVSRRGLVPSDDAAERRRRIAEHVQYLQALGAVVQREVDEPSGYCIVLKDPEGNEFCVQ
ncbi:VOC family protein [Saccharopolyspora taberi]|uniref:VOC family protein n=1 Tax=Saccharopolyspora taberi TaxID=60895 RepID=A0ABN3V132_9PSEU